jgi:hypothetical protein
LNPRTYPAEVFTIASRGVVNGAADPSCGAEASDGVVSNTPATATPATPASVLNASRRVNPALVDVRDPSVV